jgi:hypothetical protein
VQPQVRSSWALSSPQACSDALAQPAGLVSQVDSWASTLCSKSFPSFRDWDHRRISVAKSILLPGNAYCTVEIQLFVGISVVPLKRNRLSRRLSSGNPFLMLAIFAYYLFVLHDGSIPIIHPDIHRDNMDGWGIK